MRGGATRPALAKGLSQRARFVAAPPLTHEGPRLRGGLPRHAEHASAQPTISCGCSRGREWPAACSATLRAEGQCGTHGVEFKRTELREVAFRLAPVAQVRVMPDQSGQAVPSPLAPQFVTGLVPDLALRVCFGGLRPIPPRFAAVVGGTVAGKGLPPIISSAFEIDQGDLRCRMELAEEKGLATLLDRANDPPNLPARLVLADKMEVTARIGHFSSRHVSITAGERPEFAREVGLLDWTASRAGSAPSVWMGVVQGDFAWRAQGNLVVQDVNSTMLRRSEANLLLSGSYTWSVLGDKDEAVVIIDTDGRPLDGMLAVADFCALQLTFGQRLSLPWLVGLDSSGTPVSWAGLAGLARDYSSRKVSAEPPIPAMRWITPGCWTPAFFAAAADALFTKRESPAWVVFNAYLDSLDEHLDGAYLKLHVALEAVCHEVNRPSRPLLVKTPKAWLAWVGERASEIEALAVNPDAAKKLIGKVQAAMNSPATDTVEDALRALNLKVPSELLEEVAQRSRSVHRFLMNGQGRDRVLVDDWQRVRRLRTVLVAVFARLIGYTGPIHGWERDSWGHPVAATWWPHDGREIKQGFFVYRRAASVEGDTG